VTTHKLHVNILHNQCLALQTIVILLDYAVQRRDDRAVRTYERAAAWVIPELAADLPSVIIDEELVDEDATLINFDRMLNRTVRIPSDTLKGVGR
jgi:hypothetical protein